MTKPGREKRWLSPHDLEPTGLWVVNHVWSRQHLSAETHRYRLVLFKRAFSSVRSTHALREHTIGPTLEIIVAAVGLSEPAPAR